MLAWTPIRFSARSHGSSRKKRLIMPSSDVTTLISEHTVRNDVVNTWMWKENIRHVELN